MVDDYQQRDFAAYGAEGLLLAVIERAIRDARGRGHERRLAIQWMNGELDDPPLTFEETCGWLGLEPDWIVRNWPRK